MSTSREFLDFVSEQLSDVGNVTYKQMMGEYIVYINGRIAAYLCDDRLLVKPVPTAIKLMPEAMLEAPYEGAGKMLKVERIDDRPFLTELFTAIYDELPEQTKRKACGRKNR